MENKSKITSQYILKIVAPIFNNKGYAATSMADITKATGLTKGAIYGNFKNKETLAIAALKFNIKKLMTLIEAHLQKSDSPIKKLFLITDFYRGYYKYSKPLGGCPILNVGVDANNQNALLLKKVREVVKRIQGEIATIVENGIEAGEISSEINAMYFAKQMDTMIQGAIFMTYTMDDDRYLKDTMDDLDAIIKNKLST